jgi:hypothetical protein
MKIIRVFPHRTRATPTDRLAYVGGPDLFTVADLVQVSVTFTWDIPEAERLADEWHWRGFDVEIGGPAYGKPSGDFIPGHFLKPGYVITSRGCPNCCWFCLAWRREGRVARPLPIRDGWNVLDDNLLACPDSHIRAVFAMLAKQSQPPQFTGGLEAARLERWHAEALRQLHPKQVFFAYDTQDDLEPLRYAGDLMLEVGFTRASHALRCYVLCGYPKDTFEAAAQRMHEALDAGFTPMAMLYRDDTGNHCPEWLRFQREWARPAIIYARPTDLVAEQQELGL